MPEEATCQTKAETALDLIAEANRVGVRHCFRREQRW
jgi:hypothetical protein